MAVLAPIVSTWDNKGVRKAESDLDGFGGKAASALGKVGEAAKVAAKLVAGIGVAGAVGAYKAIDAASDLAESQAKVDVIFGEGAASVEAFADTAATAFGQSRQDVLNAAGVFGTFGKAAGLAGDDLADFSNGFTGLASDLASFNNATPQEAIDAIGAALRGEAEPLRRFGVLLDDATLKQEALALGIYDGNGALTAQQKILAAEAAIYKQTADAQGDFARTSDGLANQSRILKASLANVVAEIGEKLLPIALKIASFLNQKVIPVVEKVADVFGKEGFAGVVRLAGDELKRALPPALEKVKDLIVQLGSWIVNTGLPLLGEKLAQLGKALVDWIGPRIKPALKKLGELLAELGAWILDEGLPLLVEKLVALGDALVEWIGPKIGPLLKELGKLLLAIADWIVTEAVPKLGKQALKLGEALLGWVVELAPKLAKGLAGAVVDIVKKLPGLFFDLVKALADLGTDLGGSLVNALVDALKSLATKGLDVGKAFANAIIGFVNSQVIQKINDLLEFTIDPPGPGPKLTINPPDLPNIPKLAEGGIVRSPTLALIGEAGPEAVLPLSGRNAVGTGITINVSGALDPSSVAQQIRRILTQDQARLGNLSAL
jgi:hypothetical protein